MFSMRRIIGVGLLAIAVLLSIGFIYEKQVPQQKNNTQQRMIVFGDSYSDNGNDYMLSQNQYPNTTAYYQGRFSNGPVWAEYFAKLLNIDPNDPIQFVNYAYGQAKILSPSTITVYGSPNKEYSIPSLSDEVDTYEKNYAQFKTNDIVVVFISTNDFFDISSTNTQNFFVKAADYQSLQVERLIELGAKHIVVLNGRDVTLSPLAKIVARTNTKSTDETKISDYLKNFRNLIQIYNQRLNEKLSHHKEVVIYDIFEFDNNMAKKMDPNEMCYQNPQGDYQHVAGSICNNPNQFFYYDRIHTTSFVNSLLAEDVYNKVKHWLK